MFKKVVPVSVISNKKEEKPVVLPEVKPEQKPVAYGSTEIIKIVGDKK